MGTNDLRNTREISEMGIVGWSYNTLLVYLNRYQFAKYRVADKFHVNKKFIKELKDLYNMVSIRHPNKKRGVIR